MLAKADWQDLIPHRGAMRLIGCVRDWDDTRIHAQALSHRDPENPLRRDARLHAVNACEYAAQAMAIHGGLLARRTHAQAVPGWIASVREVQLQVTRLDDLPGALDIHARQMLADGAGCQYEFRIEHAAMLIANGRIAIMNRTSA